MGGSYGSARMIKTSRWLLVLPVICKMFKKNMLLDIMDKVYHFKTYTIHEIVKLSSGLKEKVIL